VSVTCSTDGCGRSALFKVRGRYRADADHDLCGRHYRDYSNSIRRKMPHEPSAEELAKYPFLGLPQTKALEHQHDEAHATRALIAREKAAHEAKQLELFELNARTAAIEVPTPTEAPSEPTEE
jgi:hypothetical protein